MIPFHVADIGIEEERAVVEVLRSGWLTSGKVMYEFEGELSKYLGNPWTLVVNSGTAGLHLALEGLGIKEGDEVIIPTLTFTATAEVIRYLGAVPVFVDVYPDTWTINVQEVIKKYTHKTKAVIPVHFGGTPCDMEPLWQMASSFGLSVIEDAAHALGSRYGSSRIGYGRSDATVFSFYATKCITTGEGGAVATWSDTLASRMRKMRLHGISRDAFNRHNGVDWEYDVVAPGYKYNMSDVSAAIGLVQLKKIEAMQSRRKDIAKRYTEEFLRCPGIWVPQWYEGSSFHLYPVQVKNRNEFMKEMHHKGVNCSVHFKPLHQMTGWYPYVRGKFPVADSIFEHCVSLPIYSKMSDADVDEVIWAVKQCLQN